MKQALELALEALESAEPKYTKQRADKKTLGGSLDYWKLSQDQRLKAITAIKEALAQPDDKKCENCGEFGECCQNAQPEQEPVVCCQQYDTCIQPCTPRGEHLARRTWVGLTDDDIADCAEKMEASDPTDSFWREFTQAIEAKLKEKNT